MQPFSRETWMICLGTCAGVCLLTISPFIRIPDFIRELLAFASEGVIAVVVWVGLTVWFGVLSVKASRREVTDMRFAMTMYSIIAFVFFLLLSRTEPWQ